MIAFMTIFLSISAKADVTTYCQDIPLEKSVVTESNEIESVFLGIKDSAYKLKVGLMFVTVTGPTNPYWRELTGKSAKVTKISLINKNANGLSVYGVKFDFPYNPEIATIYNRGDREFYTICREQIEQ